MPSETPSRSETDRRLDSDGEERVSTAKIVESIRSAPVPVVNTRYIADECDVSADELLEQLSEMVEDGTLGHHRIEDRWHLWWLTLEN